MCLKYWWAADTSYGSRSTTLAGDKRWTWFSPGHEVVGQPQLHGVSVDVGGHEEEAFLGTQGCQVGWQDLTHAAFGADLSSHCHGNCHHHTQQQPLHGYRPPPTDTAPGHKSDVRWRSSAWFSVVTLVLLKYFMSTDGLDILQGSIPSGTTVAVDNSVSWTSFFIFMDN